MTKNPILIVDDDRDDLELIEEAAKSLKLENQIYYLKSGEELVAKLKETNISPFLILCDLNLTGTNGFEVRKIVASDPAIHYKSVPFIFWSTSASEKQIQMAYDLPAQGFFFKANSFSGLCKTLRCIIDYWTESQHPKSLK